MLNLPRIFRKEPEPDETASGDATTKLPAIDGSRDDSPPTIPITSVAASSEDPEVAELDRLYREALDAMQVVEEELNRTNELLYAPDDPEGADNSNHVPEQATSQQASVTSAQQLPASPAAVTDKQTAAAPRVTPSQIIEAALFVGGAPLTIKRLCTLLKNEFEQDYVEAAVEALNRQYADEERPYEIQFGTGGYRMELRESFEAVQNRVFGIGPKDVKLGQDALEILSLVAYRQPVTKETIDELVNNNAGTILRQLLQRELIVLRRPAAETEGPQEVTYHTTGRFLQVFGLADLHELPHAEELSFK